MKKKKVSKPQATDDSTPDEVYNHYPKYVEDKPLGIDNFRSKPQERIAKNIADLIVKREVKSQPIGLEGNWGSGKSNIIKLVEKELKNREFPYFLYNYDAWGHQEDQHNRAFLEDLAEKLIGDNVKLKDEKCDINLPSTGETSLTLKDGLKYLFSRHKVVRQLKIIPNLRLSTIIIMLLLVSIPFAAAIDNVFLSNSYTLLAICIVAILSLSADFLCWWKTKEKKYRMIKEYFTEMLCIYRGQEIEPENKEFNEIIFEGEPSVREFRIWFDYLSGLLIASGNHLIIVYDNMDRLPTNKVKALWASIYTFFADDYECQYDNISIIIPFDNKHLKRVFEEDKKEGNLHNNEAYDFKNKIFSVIFRVSPPILTDWKDFFNNIFKKAFGLTEQDSIGIARNIFGRTKMQFTPRDIIVFVNELVTLKRIWKDKIPLSYIALFVLYKDKMLDDPMKYILDISKLNGVLSFFSGDDKIHEYLASLIYSVEVEHAKQVVFMRELEMVLSKKSDNPINEIAKYPQFLDILEEIGSKDELDLPIFIQVLTQLDTNLIEDKERLTQIWNHIARKLIETLNKTGIDKQSILPEYRSLLKFCSSIYRERLLRVICSQLAKAKKFKGNDYFRSIKDINEIINENKIEFNLNNYIIRRNLAPGELLEYLSEAGDEYPKYKVNFKSSELDSYLADLLPKVLDCSDKDIDGEGKIESSNERTLEVLSSGKLKHLIDDCSFDKFLHEIETAIGDSRINEKNYKYILPSYKALSTDMPLKRLDTNFLFNVLQKIEPDSGCYHDLLAMRLAYDQEYRNYLTKKSQKEKNDISDILNNPKEKLVSGITQCIQYYTTYEKLLIACPNSNYPLLNEITKKLTIDDTFLINSNIELKNILPLYAAIKKSLEISGEYLLSRLNSCSHNAIEDIKPENINEYITDMAFYEDSVTNKTELAIHIINTANDYLREIETEKLHGQWGKDESYDFKLLNIMIESNKIRKLTDNVLNVVKRVLIEIINKEKPIPPDSSIWMMLIQKADRPELKGTIKDCRDDLIKNRNIDKDLFIFINSFLIKYGDLKDKSGDVVRTILALVAKNATCLQIIVDNSKVYIPIIEAAAEEAHDFKEIVKSMVDNHPDNQDWRKFAISIGIKLSE